MKKDSKTLAIEIASKEAPASTPAVTAPNFTFNIDRKTIGTKNIPAIKSSEIHSVLGVKSHHKDWIERRISEYGFVENQDFIIDRSNLSNQTGRGGDRRTKEIWCSIEMAKMLCMVEKTPAGHATRQYFIAVEDAYQSSNVRQVLISDLMLQIPSEWEKTFPDEFFKLSVEMMTGLTFDRSKGTPSCIAGFITKYVYNFLDADIVRIAKQNRNEQQNCYAYIHQFLDAKFGKEVLKSHINVVINAMKMASQNYVIFKSLMKALVESKSQNAMLLK